MKYLKMSMQRIYYIQSLAVRKDLQSRSISFSNAQFNFSMISQLIMFSSWLLPSIKFSWRDFNVFKSSSLIISSCWRSLIICNVRALCSRKWPLKALAIALPETMCWTAFLPHTTCMHSENPDPFIEVPTLPRKLIRVWKPPRRQRMCKDFSVIISTALSHNGWSKVMHGEFEFAFFYWSITNSSAE